MRTKIKTEKILKIPIKIFDAIFEKQPHCKLRNYNHSSHTQSHTPGDRSRNQLGHPANIILRLDKTILKANKFFPKLFLFLNQNPKTPNLTKTKAKFNQKQHAIAKTKIAVV